jgi:hypothetical protein
MNVETEMSDIDENSTGNTYLQVATVAKSEPESTRKCDSQAEDAFNLVFSDPDTTALWQVVKALEPKDVFLWYDFDSQDLIVY